MATFRIGTKFLTFTVIPSSEQESYPASNLALYYKPNRSTRTVNLTAPKWAIDCGAAVHPKAWFLIGANFTTIALRAANDAAFTSGVVDLNAYTITRDDDLRTGRYQICIDWNATSVPTRRYWEFVPSNPLAGATSYELWTLAGHAAVDWTPMQQNPGFPRYQRAEPTTRLPFQGGAGDTNEDGPGYLVYEFGNPFWKTLSGVRTTLGAILNVGTAGYFSMYENNGNTAHAYIFQRLTEMPVAESFRVFNMQTTVREPS